MSTPDSAFRASVRADALKLGLPAAVADMLAREVGRVPTKEVREVMKSGGHRTYAVLSQQPPRDSLARICCAFGPRAEALADDLRTSRMPLRAVVAMLAEVTGSAREMSADAAGAVRMRLVAANHWNH